MLTKSEAIAKLNALGREEIPFSFYTDFLGNRWSVEDTNPETFRLEIKKLEQPENRKNVVFEKHPIPFDQFNRAFQQVVNEINIGNSFLTNLTFQTPVETNLTLEEIYQLSQAKYRLYVPGQFVVFSPETFVKVSDGYIYSYPMKGTIDADLPNAEARIMSDVKEQAEHVTIVDLIRNDLSQISRKVEVTKFRFIEELKTNSKKLLQVSSEVRGELDSNWKSSLGDMLSKLLPAGSISGAPKPETLSIIKNAENYDRGFYTGICGHFDGQTLDTGVMIRFIKTENSQFFYCSGGGITSFSKAEKEYQEMVDKIYLPIG